MKENSGLVAKDFFESINEDVNEEILEIDFCRSEIYSEARY